MKSFYRCPSNPGYLRRLQLDFLADATIQPNFAGSDNNAVLAGTDFIEASHSAEAIQYDSLDRRILKRLVCLQS